MSPPTARSDRPILVNLETPAIIAQVTARQVRL
jgi:hypothetical protein